MLVMLLAAPVERCRQELQALIEANYPKVYFLDGTEMKIKVILNIEVEPYVAQRQRRKKK